jgi:hypothetical protein
MDVFGELVTVEYIPLFFEEGAGTLLLKFMPFVLFFELPLALLVMVGVMKYTIERRSEPERSPFFPSVSCIITCYSEGRDVQKTIMSLTEQIYPGKIEMLAMAFPLRTTGSLGPTFVSARPVSLTVKPPYTLTLIRRFPFALR